MESVGRGCGKGCGVWLWVGVWGGGCGCVWERSERLGSRHNNLDSNNYNSALCSIHKYNNNNSLERGKENGYIKYIFYFKGIKFM